MGKLFELDFIDEKIYETEINTLKVYYIPKKDFTSSFAILTSDFGSADVEFSIDGGENFKKYPEGIAHFLEHKMFEMPGGENIFNRFTELGASVNAFTNNHQTSYHFSTTINFEENLKLLLQMVFTPYLTEENTEKEKGIIAEEIKMYDDHPGFRGYMEALKSLYVNHPVKDDIAGTVESIYKLQARDLQECYDAFYNPKNMMLVLSGDLDIDTFEKIIAEHVKPGKDINLVKKTYHEPKEAKQNSSTIEMDLQVPNYLYGIKVIPDEGDLLKQSLVGSLITKLVFGATSDFYEENLRLGEINDSFSSAMSLDREHGEIFIGGESKTPEKTLELVETYISNALLDKDFFKNKEKDLERIKKAMIGSFVNLFNDVNRIGTNTTGLLLLGENIFEYVETLKNITLMDVETKFRDFYKPHHATKVIIK